MVDRGSFHPVPRIQFIGAQSPPVSTNRGLGDQFLTSLSYHNYGGVLHDHIPRVLRTRHRPWSHSRDLSTLGSHVVRDTTHDESSQALQIGIFGRGAGSILGGGTAEGSGGFRLIDRERSSQFSRLPTHHPQRTDSRTRMGPLSPFIRYIPHALAAPPPISYSL
jgi:hypothetical protein